MYLFREYNVFVCLGSGHVFVCLGSDHVFVCLGAIMYLCV